MRIGGRRIELEPHGCFACGTLNTHGLQLELHAGDDRCWVELTLAERFQGWEGIAHGGIVATVLDEVMAWATAASGAWSFTARMSIEYRRPVPIGRHIRGEGRVVDRRRRLLTTTGRLLDPVTGEVFATAEGLYVAAPEAQQAALRQRYGFRFVADDPAAGEVPE